MSLIELYNVLIHVDGFAGKVAYRAFPEQRAPALPFICYLERSSDNFVADNRVFHKISQVDVELYTDIKEPDTESKVESALDDAGLPWAKSEDWIESERCFLITYTIEM